MGWKISILAIVGFLSSMVAFGGVPLTFTIRTDTVEGILKLLEAQKRTFWKVGEDQIEQGEKQCALAADANGYDRVLIRFSGWALLHKGNAAAICIKSLPWTMQALKRNAGRMVPPREVLDYDMEKRQVTFGIRKEV